MSLSGATKLSYYSRKSPEQIANPQWCMSRSIDLHLQGAGVLVAERRRRDGGVHVVSLVGLGPSLVERGIRLPDSLNAVKWFRERHPRIHLHIVYIRTLIGRRRLWTKANASLTDR